MRRGRMAVGAVGVILVVVAFAWASSGLHGFGRSESRYGRIVAHDAVRDRSATNSVVVTAFDYRAIDTLGEEFILFVSVVGLVVLLRSLRGESDSADETNATTARGTASTRWLGAALVGPTTVLGAYIVTHGHLTPGGGFQGGIILAAAVAAAFVAGQSVALLALRNSAHWMELADSLGAAGFALIGLGGLIATGTFFENFIANGHSGLLTGGMIPLANISVGLEVAGATLMVLAELLDKRLLVSER